MGERNPRVGTLVVGFIVCALVVGLVVMVVMIFDFAGFELGLWHAPCAMVHHQPGCSKAWR
jgi:hypothetical protein